MNGYGRHPDSTGTRYRQRGSFTLVELLVVVAVILVLLGISLKVMSMVNRKAGVARTTWVLEQVKNALGSYYATYGMYPPVKTVGYQYEKTPMTSLPAIPADMYYSTGLVYFIFSGTFHNPEAQKWQHYLDGIGSYGQVPHSNKTGFAWIYWTNSTHTIFDAWDKELRYECLSPYSTYRLWSTGPNQADNNGSVDDIGIAPGE